MPTKSPYQMQTMGLSAAEYYRRILIVLAKSQGSILIKGSDLLTITPSDGLLVRFTQEGITLHAEENWEAHVGTPGTRDPESWIKPDRPHLDEAAQPPKSVQLDDAALAKLEAERARKRAVREVVQGAQEEDGTGGARAPRVPWYSGQRPKATEEKPQ